MSTIVKKYKKSRKIICYITESKGIYTVHTGKPSDRTCLTWQYKTLEEAEQTAKPYFERYTDRTYLNKV